MELSLNTLVERMEDALFAQATRAWRMAAGIAPGAAPAVPEISELTTAETFEYLTELIGNPRTDEGKRLRLTLLRQEVARRFALFQAEQPSRALDAFMQTHRFVSAAKTWTPWEALRELPRLASRDLRNALEKDSDDLISAFAGLWDQQADALLRACSALRTTPLELAQTIRGRPLGPTQVQAAALLSDTEDAWSDLENYALRRLDVQLSARASRFHDVQRSALAPWLYELFRREDLVHAVTRCVSDLGFDLSVGGRITVDMEGREPHASSTAHLFELRVPDQIRILLRPEAGFGAYASWLNAWGVALSRAHVGRTLPFVERRLGDRAVAAAAGLLFESFLLSEAWLKRYLRLTGPQAREAARLFAYGQMYEMRRRAALVLLHRERFADKWGSARALEDDFVAHLSDALKTTIPRGLAQLARCPLGEDEAALDAWALEGRLHQTLNEKFNEDYWRNPAAGRWLVDQWAKGQREDALQTAKFLGDSELDVLRPARRRVAAMGA